MDLHESGLAAYMNQPTEIQMNTLKDLELKGK
ncbi:hypothetical protein SK3146_04850 [Paenibacillus konkukensis]|uniref:Uncharacterized protein n=1 Tax=Paenibacillus konkukensis TaxID=2020716 RepID=A0ABY4RSM0_9BACL|nr:hypothetical protein SK3146_04850 [Paenibacillus konkukensis]